MGWWRIARVKPMCMSCFDFCEINSQCACTHASTCDYDVLKGTRAPVPTPTKIPMPRLLTSRTLYFMVYWYGGLPGCAVTQRLTGRNSCAHLPSCALWQGLGRFLTSNMSFKSLSHHLCLRSHHPERHCECILQICGDFQECPSDERIGNCRSLSSGLEVDRATGVKRRQTIAGPPLNLSNGWRISTHASCVP